jgi:hypothetical protein
MPSTYTVNLGIEKPATGEQSGTWGDTTNVNFDIIDQAVNGSERVTLTSAGTSGSPNDLNIVNGSTTSSEGRNKWIEIYSASDLGGSAYVRLVPNDAEKILFIRNSLAGSQSVLLFQGTYNASNDLEIPAGVDMVVRFDGAGASATVTDVFTKLRATEITTPTLTAGTADINGGSVDGATVGAASASTGAFTTLTASTSLNIASSTTVDGVLDEDNMASDSATKLATQQSIKAYVDSQVGTVDTLAEILANGNTSGANNLIIDSGQALTANTINETTAGTGVTIDSVLLKDDVVNATDIETSNISANDGTAAATIANSTGNFTITNFISNSVDIGGGAIDGTTIGASSAAAITGTTITATSGLTAQANATVLSTLTLGSNPSDPGILLINDNSTTAYTLALKGTGTRTYALEGSSSGGNYNLTLANASTADGFHFTAYGAATFNENGDSWDFRVESNSQTHMLFVDASADQVGVGTSAPSEVLTVKSSGSGTETVAVEMSGNLVNLVSLGQNSNGHGEVYVRTNNGVIQHSISADGGVVFNEGSLDQNFRIETNGSTDTFFVDGGTNNIGIGTSTTYAHQQGTALDFVYSGTIWAGNTYWAGGMKTGESFYVTTSGDKYKLSSRQAVQTYHNSQGGSIHFYSAAGGTADDVITWQEIAEFDRTDTVFNNGGVDQNFRVESDGNANMLFVDAGNNRIGVGTNSGTGSLHIKDVRDSGGSDVTVIAQNTTANRIASYQILDESNNITTKIQYDNGGNRGALNIQVPTAGNADVGFDGTTFLIASNSSSAALVLQSNSTDRFKLKATSEGVFNNSGNDYDFRVESNSNTHAFYVDAGNNVTGTNVPFQLGAIGNGTNAQIFNSLTPTANTATDIFSVDIPSGAFACYIDVMQNAGSGYAGRTAQYLWYARRATAGNSRAVVELSNNSLGSVNAGVIPVPTFTATAVTTGTYTEKFQFESTRSDPIFFVLRVVGSYATSITPV